MYWIMQIRFRFGNNRQRKTIERKDDYNPKKRVLVCKRTIQNKCLLIQMQKLCFLKFLFLINFNKTFFLL